MVLGAQDTFANAQFAVATRSNSVAVCPIAAVLSSAAMKHDNRSSTIPSTNLEQRRCTRKQRQGRSFFLFPEICRFLSLGTTYTLLKLAADAAAAPQCRSFQKLAASLILAIT